MVNTLALRIPRRRAYWAPGHPIGAPVLNFRQLQYLPLPNAEPDLNKALQGSWIDCGLDLHKQLIEFGGAAKVWMTVLVEYEPVNPMVNKQPFDQYLSATPTRIFKSDEPLTPFKNPYIDSLRIEEDDLKGPKVRDHDHITGFFLTAAHRQCNLECPVSFRIPVFFHNFRGYDAHLIVHEFGKRPDREIKVIGQNMEKYL